MPAMNYIEDIFLELTSYVFTGKLSYQDQDFNPIMSFHDAITMGKLLTKKQSIFMLKILQKYKNQFETLRGIDITAHLETPNWKNEFRDIDYSKKVSVSIDDDQIIWLNVKFPFALKDSFVKEFSENGKSKATWSPEERAQKVKLYDINVVRLYDFCTKNNFDFDQDFLDLVESVEDIWSEENDIAPHSVVEDKKVFLKNASETAQEYFDNHKNNDLTNDLFLAKSMGFPVVNFHENSIRQTMASTTDTKFWIKTIDTLTDVLEKTDQWPVVIFLDRTSDISEWTSSFVESLKTRNLPQDMVRVCFRFKNDDIHGKEFNTWVKENNLGGEVSTGKIFICQHKPPKWMLKDDFRPKIMISNTLYPHTSTTTNSMLNSHHTIFYVGNIRPSLRKDTSIVEL